MAKNGDWNGGDQWIVKPKPWIGGNGRHSHQIRRSVGGFLSSFSVLVFSTTLELFLVDSAGSSIAAYYGRCLDTREQNRTNITHLDVDVDRNVVQVQFTGGTHKYLCGGNTGRRSL